MKISQRLESICKFVKKDSFVADIGADHGLVEKYLVDENITNRITAVENKIGPYSILKSTLTNYPTVKIILSDGIKDIDDSVDTLIIAGMGGINIVEIIKKNISKLKNIMQIIVDPHRDSELVRRAICNLGYKIEQEKIIIEDGKFYNIISFVQGHCTYSEDELIWGVKVFESDNFEAYKQYNLQQLNKKMNSLKCVRNISLQEINKIESLIERLNKYGNK